MRVWALAAAVVTLECLADLKCGFERCFFDGCRYNLGMTIRCVDAIYIADTARVLGEVELAENVSLWYGVSVRGDVAGIRIGRGTNVQDNAVIHCDSGVPNEIGAGVTIGHGAIVHGQSVGDGSLIGMGAKVLGRTRIGCHCLIAAGAVVPPGMAVGDGRVVVGVPGKIVRETSEEERKYLAWLAPHYVRLAQLHHQHPDDPRVRARFVNTGMSAQNRPSG